MPSRSHKSTRAVCRIPSNGISGPFSTVIVAKTSGRTQAISWSVLTCTGSRHDLPSSATIHNDSPSSERWTVRICLPSGDQNTTLPSLDTRRRPDPSTSVTQIPSAVPKAIDPPSGEQLGSPACPSTTLRASPPSAEVNQIPGPSVPSIVKKNPSPELLHGRS